MAAEGADNAKLELVLRIMQEKRRIKEEERRSQEAQVELVRLLSAANVGAAIPDTVLAEHGVEGIAARRKKFIERERAAKRSPSPDDFHDALDSMSVLDSPAQQMLLSRKPSPLPPEERPPDEPAPAPKMPALASVRAQNPIRVYNPPIPVYLIPRANSVSDQAFATLGAQAPTPVLPDPNSMEQPRSNHSVQESNQAQTRLPFRAVPMSSPVRAQAVEALAPVVPDEIKRMFYNPIGRDGAIRDDAVFGLTDRARDPEKDIYAFARRKKTRQYPMARRSIQRKMRRMLRTDNLLLEEDLDKKWGGAGRALGIWVPPLVPECRTAWTSVRVFKEFDGQVVDFVDNSGMYLPADFLGPRPPDPVAEPNELRWMRKDTEDVVLPLYGESDDEYDYDPEYEADQREREREAERAANPDALLKKRKRSDAEKVAKPRTLKVSKVPKLPKLPKAPKPAAHVRAVSFATEETLEEAIEATVDDLPSLPPSSTPIAKRLRAAGDRPNWPKRSDDGVPTKARPQAATNADRPVVQLPKEVGGVIVLDSDSDDEPLSTSRYKPGITFKSIAANSGVSRKIGTRAPQRRPAPQSIGGGSLPNHSGGYMGSSGVWGSPSTISDSSPAMRSRREETSNRGDGHEVQRRRSMEAVSAFTNPVSTLRKSRVAQPPGATSAPEKASTAAQGSRHRLSAFSGRADAVSDAAAPRVTIKPTGLATYAQARRDGLPMARRKKSVNKTVNFAPIATVMDSPPAVGFSQGRGQPQSSSQVVKPAANDMIDLAGARAAKPVVSEVTFSGYRRALPGTLKGILAGQKPPIESLSANISISPAGKLTAMEARPPPLARSALGGSCSTSGEVKPQSSVYQRLAAELAGGISNSELTGSDSSSRPLVVNKTEVIILDSDEGEIVEEVAGGRAAELGTGVDEERVAEAEDNDYDLNMLAAGYCSD